MKQVLNLTLFAALSISFQVVAAQKKAPPCENLMAPPIAVMPSLEEMKKKYRSENAQISEAPPKYSANEEVTLEHAVFEIYGPFDSKILVNGNSKRKLEWYAPNDQLDFELRRFLISFEKRHDRRSTPVRIQGMYDSDSKFMVLGFKALASSDAKVLSDATLQFWSTLDLKEQESVVTQISGFLLSPALIAWSHEEWRLKFRSLIEQTLPGTVLTDDKSPWIHRAINELQSAPGTHREIKEKLSRLSEMVDPNL